MSVNIGNLFGYIERTIIRGHERIKFPPSRDNVVQGVRICEHSIAEIFNVIL